ncbi:hypothetical protein [Sedimenticola sp.]|uniref:hypothetical protein n=1 Tax=Sedimenticola sp. TaxID=1940285 RepID=UPI003D0F40CD
MAYWLYPANTKLYDVLGAFSKKSAYWPVKSKVEKGDKVLIYLAAPYKQIGFATDVAETGLEQDEIFDKVSPFFKQIPDTGANNKPFMKLVNINVVRLDKTSQLSLDRLKEAGLRGMLMGPRKLDNTPELLAYIKGNLK